jgi:hypothetical protein
MIFLLLLWSEIQLFKLFCFLDRPNEVVGPKNVKLKTDLNPTNLDHCKAFCFIKF